MSGEARLREDIAAFGRLLTGLGLAHGSTGVMRTEKARLAPKRSSRRAVVCARLESFGSCFAILDSVLMCHIEIPPDTRTRTSMTSESPRDNAGTLTHPT